jgi:hypothetical protein
MELLNGDLKRSICSLFDVYADENGVQRIVTPIEYPAPPTKSWSVSACVKTAKPRCTSGWPGDTESKAMKRWREELPGMGPVRLSDDETLFCEGTRQI